jgi:hypothetical protein
VAWTWARELRLEGGLDPQDWFILGVIIGFTGQALDNTYWLVAWHLHFIHHPLAWIWFENGATANLPFRQGSGIAAGLCHLIAAHKYSQTRDSAALSIVILGSAAAVMIYTTILWTLRA